MRHALSFAVAYCYDYAQLFPGVKLVSRLYPAVCHGHPTGIESELLGKEHQLLPIVATFFFKVSVFLPYHCDIIRHAGEFAIVCHRAVEGLGLMGDKLYMQPAPAVELRYFILQHVLDLAFNLLLLIRPHGMARPHGFVYIHLYLHTLLPSRIFIGLCRRAALF